MRKDARPCVSTGVRLNGGVFQKKMIMNNKYKNKYRIKSHRMPGWDYSGNGFYFVTIVTQNRICNLGEIAQVDGQPAMILSDFGKIVETEWHKSFKIRDELLLDEFQLMPNHLHAIIVLEKTNSGNDNDSTNSRDSQDSHVETHGRASLQLSQSSQSPESPQPQLFRKPKSISSFIGGFKSAINSKIDDYIDEQKLNIPKYNRNNHFFQPNYHDRIIRDENEYYRIKNYITNNPLHWNDDRFNPSNPDHDQ